MRLAAVTLAALALASSAASSTGDWATAFDRHGDLVLKLHYEMTCGRPGPGPVEIRLPRALRLLPPVSAYVNGKRQPSISGAHRVTVQLPKPPQVTCMSIGPGVLTVELTGVLMPSPGTYPIAVSVGAHRLTARFHVG